MIEVLKIRARRLRKNSTDAEHHLWYLLRDRRFNRYKFRRQYVIQPYIVDFVCLKRKLIIELDGGQHADLRFWNYKDIVYYDFGMKLYLKKRKM